MYKLVTFHWNREDALDGPVFAGDERWESIDEALDELSAHGWEIQLPIYGPARHAGGGATRLDGFVLVNKAASKTDDVRRRIDKLERALARQAAGGGNGARMRLEQELTALREFLPTEGVASAAGSAFGQLPFRAFADGPLSTEADFALAEWPQPGQDDDGR